MGKDFQKLFNSLEPAEPPAGLFDRIILAIKREREIRKIKSLLFGFLPLFIISFIAMPFSLTLLLEQIENSGILYFVSTAISDFSIFLNLWQDFGLAILESLPILAIALFTVNIVLILWTLRVFLYRKKLLLPYLS